MDFFSKFTKPADHSKPASESQEPNSITEPSNTDLFSSAKVVAGAAQSYFSHQPATYENTEVAGATADILDAASEYGKLDKTQGVGKYVDEAESYLKKYESSNTKPAATSAADTAVDAGVKAAPTTEATETDTAATKGADASTEESTKHKSYVEDKTEGLSSKPPAVDAPVKTNTSDVYGENKADGLPNKTSGGGAATETGAGGDYTDTQAGGGGEGGGATTKTDVSDDYQKPKVDKYEESTEEDFTKKPTAAATDASVYHAKGTEEGISDKPSSGVLAAGTDSGDSGYAKDSEESLPKPSAGGYAAGDDASEKVSHAEGGFGAEALAEIKTLIFNSDYVAVSMQKTGSYSSPWQKILPIDTEEIAYLKAKRSAERYQILQFAVCPFFVKDSKLIAHPFNFHLFPRDELKFGMPSYSFSCQSSHLTSMAREGFDFNGCFYNGISYLSRAQESAAIVRMGNLRSSDNEAHSSPVHSVADSVFSERIKSRVKNWRNACKDSNRTDDALISSLRKVIAGSEKYGSRPCLSIDVCSERQVLLVLEMLKGFADVVPLRAPVKGGGMQVVRVVLTCSEEDKNLLEEELRNMEEEQNRSIRGFREVIDLISTSQKPVVAYNSLNDFASIYSKFLDPLPLTMNEFCSSLLLVFPLILDTNHLLTKCKPFEKSGGISGSISYLKKRFSAPIDMEIPDQESGNVNVQGNYVLKLCQLFVTLHSILKINPQVHESDNSPLSPSVQRHANNFGPVSEDYGDSSAEDIRIWTGSSRRVSTDNLVFLLGFEAGATAGKVKRILHDSHDVFSKEFDVRMVDRTCAVVVFWTPGFSEQFLRIMGSGEILLGKLREMISEGLRAVDYDTYRRACKSVLWETDLAECLDEASGDKEMSQQEQQSVISWNSDEMINLDEL